MGYIVLNHEENIMCTASLDHEGLVRGKHDNSIVNALEKKKKNERESRFEQETLVLLSSPPIARIVLTLGAPHRVPVSILVVAAQLP